MIRWFLKTPPPSEPFKLHQGVTIRRPANLWRYLEGDIAAGAGRGRAYTGALQRDLRRLAELFDGPVPRASAPSRRRWKATATERKKHAMADTFMGCACDACDASPLFKRYTRDADNRYKRHKRHNAAGIGDDGVFDKVDDVDDHGMIAATPSASMATAGADNQGAKTPIRLADQSPAASSRVCKRELKFRRI